jgi:acetyltransferase EpsM
MKKVIILGGSGIGMIAASIFERTRTAEVVGFLNDVLPARDVVGKRRVFEVLGRTSDLPKYLDQGCSVFIAYVGLGNEKATYEKIMKLSIPSANWLLSAIDPTAVIPNRYCWIGHGVLFAPHSQLSPDVTVSDNCKLMGGAFVGHDSFLDHSAHLATNAVVGANAHVGKGVHIGSNATVREKVRIGDFALIGAGAVVLNDVPENAVVVGNPARILRVRE